MTDDRDPPRPGAAKPPGRRRRRQPRPAGAPNPAPDPRPDQPQGSSATGDPQAAKPRPERRDENPTGPTPAGRRGQRERPARTRAMRDLAGSGRSALGVEGALRARDVDRPTEADLAAAERDLKIVHRNWSPPPRPADATAARPGPKRPRRPAGG